MLVEEKVSTVVTSSELFCDVVLNSGKVGRSRAKLTTVHVDRDVVPSVAGAVVSVACFTFEDESSLNSHVVKHVADRCEAVDDVDGVGRNVLANDAGDDSTDDELDGSWETEVDLTVNNVASVFGYVEDAINNSWKTVAEVKNAVGLVGTGKSRAWTGIRAACSVAAWSTCTGVASKSEWAIVESLAGTRSGDAETVYTSLTSFETVDAFDWVAGVCVVLGADTNVAKADLRGVTVASYFASAASGVRGPPPSSPPLSANPPSVMVPVHAVPEVTVNARSAERNKVASFMVSLCGLVGPCRYTHYHCML